MPAHACAPPLAAAAGRRRCWCGVWVRVPYPAWFFLNQVYGYGLRAYRYPNQTRSAPDPNRSSWTANSCDCWVEPLRLLGRTVATVQTEPLQPFAGFRPVGPSWSAIYSALGGAFWSEPNRTVATVRSEPQQPSNRPTAATVYRQPLRGAVRIRIAERVCFA